MVLPTGVSARIGMAFRQRFSGYGEGRRAYKLRLSAAMYAQGYAQTPSGDDAQVPIRDFGNVCHPREPNHDRQAG